MVIRLGLHIGAGATFHDVRGKVDLKSGSGSSCGLVRLAHVLVWIAEMVYLDCRSGSVFPCRRSGVFRFHAQEASVWAITWADS